MTSLFNGIVRQIHPFEGGRLGSNMGQQFWIAAGLTGLFLGIPGITEMFSGLVAGVEPGASFLAEKAINLLP